MNKPNMEDIDKVLPRIGLIHIAFNVGSKEKVDEPTEQLKQDAYKVINCLHGKRLMFRI